MDHSDPRRSHFEPYGLTCVSWKPERMPRPDTHNEIELNLILNGWVEYMHGGRRIRFQSEQLFAFWASIPHQVLSFSEDCDYLVVTIPLTWFLQFRLPEEFVQSILHGKVVQQSMKGKSTHEEKSFLQWKDDLNDEEPTLQNIVLLEMEAKLARMARSAKALRSAYSKPSRSKTAKSHLIESQHQKVERIARVVAQRYLEPLSAESIGKSVDLHPNYAMNLFKKAFGTTLVDYITHHRVSHAQRLLVTTDRKILDVAMASGFNTLSRFKEAFRRNCGCTPREYRKYQYSNITQK
ncbi:helix-turn-helix domain-containing protein [Pelagicoccus sp. SDUM812002]|uniref:helix-turn-helix domain-containing protein n=1 Tax=Pelagicoccus sp. SDUM812002 TaxID=3041266 RepID=UPI00280FFE08|nr:helix-turn-helix domain-containing protein [Pelagicoccus sp. SDUM812002]MDQ8184639.1 helix-turn-helix domain-containing protein [Pelagicoccus sp. SDUM812002]